MSGSNLNFGLINQVPLPEPGKQVAQRVFIPQSPLGQFASGLSSGLQSGQQMALERQRAAIAQQQANLQSQLAPSQIAMANAQAQQTQMQTQMMQQQIARQSVLAGIANGQMPGQQAPSQQMAAPQPQGAMISPQGMPQGQPPVSPQGQSVMQSPLQGSVQLPQMGQQTQANPQVSAQQSSDPDHQGYNQAVVSYYYKTGRPDLAMQFLQAQNSLVQSTIKSQSELQKMTADEASTKYDHFQKAGAIAYSLTNLPDDKAVSAYNQNYGKIINNIDENAPKPGSDPQSILAYLHGAASANLQVKQAIARNPDLASKLIPGDKEQQEFLNTIKTGKGTPSQIETVTDYVSKLRDDIQKATPGSPEALQAQNKLDTALHQVKQNDSIWTRISNTITGIGSGLSKSAPKAPSTNKVWTYNPQTGKLE